MENLNIYNQARTVPKEALKAITGGRLNGKSDINPMWRLKKLTELFGPCGIGWKYIITKQWLEPGANNEIAAFVNIEVYVKHEGAWSEAIPGTGGSSFVAKEKGGLYTSDECFKMALTDAISVACKALGFGADVYWDKDATKYNNNRAGTTTTSKEELMDAKGWADFWKVMGGLGYDEIQVCAKAGVKNKEELQKFSRVKAVELFNRLKKEAA